MTTLNKILSMYMGASDRYNTKKSLAEALHLSRPALHDRWNGTVEWRFSEIKLLCRILKIPDQEILKLIK